MLCAKLIEIAPARERVLPDLDAMLAHADAALIIGDNALFLDHRAKGLEKIDLGEAWYRLTGLPFVYAFWAGRADAAGPEHVEALQRARETGVTHAAEIAARFYPADPAKRTIAERYLRDNMKYGHGAEEIAALELFYRYAAESGCVSKADTLRFLGSARR